MTYEVNEPILNSPFDELQQYWFIRDGYEPKLRTGRRPAIFKIDFIMTEPKY